MLASLRRDLKKFASVDKAKIYARFFKTQKGEYAEGDKFIGVSVPQTRLVAKKYLNLNFKDLENLIKSPVHEERLCALLILTYQFEKGDQGIKSRIFKFYLANTKYINNWDLVDLSADKIIGGYLENKPKDTLINLAKSKSLWEKRVAILATFHFIKKGDANWSIKIAKILLNDKHDLIHKAVGWMLREVGKRIDKKILVDFLNQYASQMPRTALRYSIEHFPQGQRQKYLKMKG